MNIDEHFYAMVATAAAFVAAVFAVLDCMVNGILTTSLHLAVVLATIITVRITIGRCLRVPRPAPAGDDGHS